MMKYQNFWNAKIHLFSIWISALLCLKNVVTEFCLCYLFNFLPEFRQKCLERQQFVVSEMCIEANVVSR